MLLKRILKCDKLCSLPLLVDAPHKTGSRILSHFIYVEMNGCSQHPWRLLEDSPDVMDECFSMCLQNKQKSMYRVLAVLNHDRVWQEVRFSKASQLFLPINVEENIYSTQNAKN